MLHHVDAISRDLAHARVRPLLITWHGGAWEGNVAKNDSHSFSKGHAWALHWSGCLTSFFPLVTPATKIKIFYLYRSVSVLLVTLQNVGDLTILLNNCVSVCIQNNTVLCEKCIGVGVGVCMHGRLFD